LQQGKQGKTPTVEDSKIVRILSKFLLSSVKKLSDNAHRQRGKKLTLSLKVVAH